MAQLAVARPPGPNGFQGPAHPGGRPSAAAPFRAFPAPANMPQAQQIQTAAAAVQQQRKAQHNAKSTPPDPEDLRRRLFVVISEQNARRRLRAGQQRLSQIVREKEGAAQIESQDPPRDDEWSSSEYSSRSSSANQPTSAPWSSTIASRPRPSSCHNLLQRAADQPHGQHQHGFIPTQAAKQFTRTATADSSLRDPNLAVHTLGRTQSVRERHSRGQLDPRNRHSMPNGGPGEDHAAPVSPRRRASAFGLDAAVAESGELSEQDAAPAIFARPSNDRSRAAAAMVDWSQSDEAARARPIPGREADKDKPSRRIMSPGLLRKADSLWTLRLGRSRRGTGDKMDAAPEAAPLKSKEKKGDDSQREGGILPLGGKGARASVGAPKSPRGGFFARLRRHS